MENDRDLNTDSAVQVGDITSDEINRLILRMLDEDDPDVTHICIDDRDRGEYDLDEASFYLYCYRNIRELNVIAHLIGSSTRVVDLSLNGGLFFGIGHMQPFFRELARNRTIHTIRIGLHALNQTGATYFRMLTPFLKNNHNLTQIVIDECELGDDGCRLLSSALNCVSKSLTIIEISNCDITDDQSVDIISSLAAHPQLESIYLHSNSIGAAGCNELATLIQCSATNLQVLNLCFNPIGDEGIKALAAAFRTSNSLTCLYMCHNFIGTEGIEALVDALKECKSFRELTITESFTMRGIRAISTLAEGPHPPIEEIHMFINPPDSEIIDQTLLLFTNALANNNTLRILALSAGDINCSESSWDLLSNLLCDTSTVNATYCSNHTLRVVASNCPEELEALFVLNRSLDVDEIAIAKILQSHSDISMQPFFQWNFKMLPYAIGWLQRAEDIQDENATLIDEDISARKLSTIYQFIRGMPNEYIRARSIDIVAHSNKRLRSGVVKKYE